MSPTAPPKGVVLRVPVRCLVAGGILNLGGGGLPCVNDVIIIAMFV